MIDLHTHILPGLDDGSSNLTESLAMAAVGLKDGIHTIVATPHVLQGVFDNDRNEILAAVAALNQTLQEHNIAVNILPGAEYCMHHKITELNLYLLLCGFVWPKF
jgi:protein-tyrosine phosphatase